MPAVKPVSENNFDELVIRHRIYLCEKSILCLGHLREVDKNIFDMVKRFIKKLPSGWLGNVPITLHKP